MTSSLPELMQELLPVIENDLRTIVSRPESAPDLFYRMMQYHMGWVDEHGQPSHQERGKRIRPLLTLLVSQAVCGSYQPARPAAVAVELIHNFSLLHDDIQDRSPMRRSRPTAWRIWGEKQAINAGDSMFALAHLAVPRLAPPDMDPAILLNTMLVLDETCLELTRGQHLDMYFENRSEVTSADYLNMIAGKTAALVSAAAALGALAARVEPARRKCFADFGYNLGMAFQVRDDILDIWGDPAATGKEASVDIKQRKKSFPVLIGLEREPALRDLYADGEPFSEMQITRIKDLLDSCGARAQAEKTAGEYTRETVSSLQAANPGGAAGEALFELVEILLHRDR